MNDQADRARRPEAEWRRSWSKRVQVSVIAGLGAPLLRLLARTWRVEVVGAEHVAAATGGGPDRCIYAIWHGRILPSMWCWRDHGIVVVTSENFDGEWIARIIQRFGFGVARGSSTRGGSRALRELLRTLRHAPAGFTVDGPRGPRGVVQPGVVWLARATGHPIVCLNTEAARSWTVNSWDRAQIPKPFTRVVATVSPAIRVPADADAVRLEAVRLEVEAALGEASRAGQRALGRAEVPS